MKNSGSGRISVVEDILNLLNSLIPSNVSGDLRKNFLASVKVALENMDIASRSELEVQEIVLRKAREKIQHLELRVAELEAQSADKSNN